MTGLFESGRIVDLLMVLMTLEAALLWAYRRKTGRGVPAFGLVANLAAGAGLQMALRAALTHAGWEMTILWLLVALAAHVADLASRWR